jgi:hypothetical protein
MVFIVYDIILYDVILHIVYDIVCTYDIVYDMQYDIVYDVVYDIVCFQSFSLEALKMARASLVCFSLHSHFFARKLHVLQCIVPLHVPFAR